MAGFPVRVLISTVRPPTDMRLTVQRVARFDRPVTFLIWTDALHPISDNSRITGNHTLRGFLPFAFCGRANVANTRFYRLCVRRSQSIALKVNRECVSTFFLFLSFVFPCLGRKQLAILRERGGNGPVYAEKKFDDLYTFYIMVRRQNYWLVFNGQLKSTAVSRKIVAPWKRNGANFLCVLTKLSRFKKRAWFPNL